MRAGIAGDAEGKGGFASVLALAARIFQWLRREGEHLAKSREPPWTRTRLRSRSAEEEAPARRRSEPVGASEALLLRLARAQDAVARLEAAVMAAPDDLAAGLRARPALFEAAGFLAYCGPAVNPHDLALRDTNLTGSYTLAALTGRLREAAPWSTAAGGEEEVADDHLVAQALAYARHWRRLTELATLRPLVQVGVPLADDAPTRAWLAPCPATGSVRGCSPPPGHGGRAARGDPGGPALTPLFLRRRRAPDRRITGQRPLPGCKQAAPPPCASRSSPDACSPAGSMFRRGPGCAENNKRQRHSSCAG